MENCSQNSFLKYRLTTDTGSWDIFSKQDWVPCLLGQCRAGPRTFAWATGWRLADSEDHQHSETSDMCEGTEDNYNFFFF